MQEKYIVRLDDQNCEELNHVVKKFSVSSTKPNPASIGN